MTKYCKAGVTGACNRIAGHEGPHSPTPDREPGEQKLFRVSAVEYMLAESAQDAADITAYAWDSILRESGDLCFIVEELEPDDLAFGVAPYPLHFHKLHGEINGEVNQYEQPNFTAMKRRVNQMMRSKGRLAPARKRTAKQSPTVGPSTPSVAPSDSTDTTPVVTEPGSKS